MAERVAYFLLPIVEIVLLQHTASFDSLTTEENVIQELNYSSVSNILNKMIITSYLNTQKEVQTMMMTIMPY